MPSGRRDLARSLPAILVSIALLALVIVFSAMHVSDAERFAALVERAEPLWILVAVAIQLNTYLCAGAIWALVARAAGRRLPLGAVARLAVEKLTVDQLLPAGGMSGNVVAVRAMARMGLPLSVATEALLIEIVASYCALAALAAAALVVLAFHHDVTPAVVALLGVFAVVVAAVPLTIAWLVRRRDRPPRGLSRFRMVRRFVHVLATIDARRLRDGRLLASAITLQGAIVLLDAATLWAAVRALGAEVDPLTAFVAMVLATIAGTLSLLPGGLGSFEAACTATLALLGVPVEVALTATLLLRGLSLWVPLAPGIWLARRDLASTSHRGEPAGPAEGRARPSAPLPELFEHLRSARTGLAAAEASARLALWGPNSLDERRQRSVLNELWRALASPLPIILMIAAVTTGLLGELTDAVIIGAMVALSAGVNVWQSSRSARALRTLEAHVTPTATVRRGGDWFVVPRRDLVPGDIVRLSAGDLVPADARIVESTHLHVEQAALTGESLPVEKQATEGALTEQGPSASQLVFAGTSVVSGSASALVVATGARTSFGDVAARLATRPEETEFERGARRFGVLILQTVTFLVLLVLVVNLALGRDAFSSLLFAVALAVGLTPEYLPMITSVTLAQGALQMSRQKVIVRHLAAIQNLGSIDVLCSDKTGTLTTGKMSLAAALDTRGRPCARVLALARLNSAFEAGVKSPLDTAILDGAGESIADGYRKLGEIPFDFERRRITLALERAGELLVVTKGAPESVLASCDRVELDGEARPLDDSERARCDALFRSLSADGYRVLAVASRTGKARGAAEEESELALAGFLTFADEILPDVADAIARLRSDGVAVKILSGDNELVTRTLCRRAGIPAESLVTGAQLATADERALGVLAERTDVFARVSPAQKHAIVIALKHRGHVVGFLGDGINDAPSLHGADVGISVAGAADVAREASDIVLLERRLEVLHAGIVAGRRSFANVLKYLLMGTSSNFGNVLSMAAAVFFLPFLPMLPTQILVNNFLYDLSQITIPTDRVDPAYLRGPQRWDIGVVRRFMWTIGPISSVFDMITFAVFLLVFRFGESLFQTGWFVESLSTQVLVLFVIRTAGRPWSQRPSLPLAITALTVVALAIALPYSPLAPALGMTPLPPQALLVIALIVPTYLIAVELLKTRVVRGSLARAARATTSRAPTHGVGIA